MPDSQEREEEHEGSRPETDSPARPPRVSKLPERSYQQPITALEHDRCGRDCDRRQRIPLPLDIQRWGLPHAPPSRSHRQHATSRRRRHRRSPTRGRVPGCGRSRRSNPLRCRRWSEGTGRSCSDSGGLDAVSAGRDGGGRLCVGERPRSVRWTGGARHSPLNLKSLLPAVEAASRSGRSMCSAAPLARRSMPPR